MTDEEVVARLALLRQRLWPYAEIADWFGIQVENDSPSFLAQYRIWSEQYRSGGVVFDGENRLINRNALEVFLQSRELVGIRSAAIQWGMTEKSFIEVLLRAAAAGYVTPSEAGGEFPGVYRAALVDDFHKRFPNLARRVFANYTNYIQRLHDEIRSVLKIEITPVYCRTSLALEENPPEYANALDSITQEPMGIGFQLWIETKKPLQLRPDSCSWITYVQFEQVLEGQLIGSHEELLGEKRDALRKYLGL